MLSLFSKRQPTAAPSSMHDKKSAVPASEPTAAPSSVHDKKSAVPASEPTAAPSSMHDKKNNPETPRRAGRGRPKGRTKTALVQFRATPAEREAIQTLAKNQGISIAALCLSILTTTQKTRKRRTSPTPEQLALLKELNRIGNNINQIARWYNSHSECPEALQMGVELANIGQELKRCTSAI